MSYHIHNGVKTGLTSKSIFKKSFQNLPFFPVSSSNTHTHTHTHTLHNALLKRSIIIDEPFFSLVKGETVLLEK